MHRAGLCDVPLMMTNEDWKANHPLGADKGTPNDVTE